MKKFYKYVRGINKFQNEKNHEEILKKCKNFYQLENL